MKYRITFDRISQDDNVPDLITEADSMDELKKKIYDYARPKTYSSSIAVVIQKGCLSGSIISVFHCAGSFKIEEIKKD